MAKKLSIWQIRSNQRWHLIGHAKRAKPLLTTPKQGTLDTDRIAKNVAPCRVSQNAPCTKVTLGRDDLDVKGNGRPINARMALIPAAAFVANQ